jgi:hypothetical protein
MRKIMLTMLTKLTEMEMEFGGRRTRVMWFEGHKRRSLQTAARHASVKRHAGNSRLQ